MGAHSLIHLGLYKRRIIVQYKIGMEYFDKLKASHIQIMQFDVEGNPYPFYLKYPKAMDAIMQFGVKNLTTLSVESTQAFCHNTSPCYRSIAVRFVPCIHVHLSYLQTVVIGLYPEDIDPSPVVLRKHAHQD